MKTKFLLFAFMLLSAELSFANNCVNLNDDVSSLLAQRFSYRRLQITGSFNDEITLTRRTNTSSSYIGTVNFNSPQLNNRAASCRISVPKLPNENTETMIISANQERTLSSHNSALFGDLLIDDRIFINCVDQWSRNSFHPTVADLEAMGMDINVQFPEGLAECEDFEDGEIRINYEPINNSTQDSNGGVL